MLVMMTVTRLGFVGSGSSSTLSVGSRWRFPSFAFFVVSFEERWKRWGDVEVIWLLS